MDSSIILSLYIESIIEYIFLHFLYIYFSYIKKNFCLLFIYFYIFFFLYYLFK